MSRIFFALWPDNDTRSSLCTITQQFKDEKFRLVKKSNLHITLEFLGEVSEDDLQQLVEKSNGIQAEPFEIELTRIGWWRKPGVLWIGTHHSPKQLIHLVESIKQIVEQQGLETDKRSYEPHVTIARKVKQLQLPKQSIDIRWQVNSFVLVISKPTNSGVEYHVIHEWPLT
jgi:RNA 2',3'-cyclic 3'-phosphodiesterase